MVVHDSRVTRLCDRRARGSTAVLLCRVLAHGAVFDAIDSNCSVAPESAKGLESIRTLPASLRCPPVRGLKGGVIGNPTGFNDDGGPKCRNQKLIWQPTCFTGRIRPQNQPVMRLARIPLKQTL